MASDKVGEKHFYDLLKKRDKKAMEFLYDNYAPVMYGIIMNITRNEALADEVMAKTFRYIWKNHSEFDPDRMNVCLWIINVSRRMCKEVVGFGDFSRQLNEPSVFTATGAGKMNMMEFPASSKSKNVFDLLFFGNGSVAEVAKHVGMSEKEIKQSAREAVSNLIRVTEKA